MKVKKPIQSFVEEVFFFLENCSFIAISWTFDLIENHILYAFVSTLPESLYMRIGISGFKER
jgi:hypothetical protein